MSRPPDLVRTNSILEDLTEFIGWFHETFGYAPTVRECAEAIGVRSSSTAHKYLQTLEKRGTIIWVPEVPRTIRLK